MQEFGRGRANELGLGPFLLGVDQKKYFSDNISFISPKISFYHCYTLIYFSVVLCDIRYLIDNMNKSLRCTWFWQDRTGWPASGWIAWSSPCTAPWPGGRCAWVRCSRRRSPARPPAARGSTHTEELIDFISNVYYREQKGRQWLLTYSRVIELHLKSAYIIILA